MGDKKRDPNVTQVVCVGIWAAISVIVGLEAAFFWCTSARQFLDIHMVKIRSPGSPLFLFLVLFFRRPAISKYPRTGGKNGFSNVIWIVCHTQGVILGGHR